MSRAMFNEKAVKGIEVCFPVKLKIVSQVLVIYSFGWFVRLLAFDPFPAIHARDFGNFKEWAGNNFYLLNVM